MRNRFRLVRLRFRLKEANRDHHTREGIGEVADFIFREAAHAHPQVAQTDVLGNLLEMFDRQQDRSCE